MSSPLLESSFEPSEPAPQQALYRTAGNPAPRTLLDVLDATAAAHPQAIALDTGSEALTYRDLCIEIERRARQLRDRGIGPGDRVGVRVPSGTAELYLSILAVLRSGAAYVPVDADDPDERAATVFREAAVCAVLGPDGPLPGPARPSATRVPRAPGRRLDHLHLGFDRRAQGRGGQLTAPPPPSSTPRPTCSARTSRWAPATGCWPGCPSPSTPPAEMWLAWRYGACLVPAPRALVRAGHELGPWLVERGITVVSTVPTLAALWPDEAMRRVRLLIVGGESCPAGLVDRFGGPGRGCGTPTARPRPPSSPAPPACCRASRSASACP
ncbi:AMP-binding protein [Streptomyces albulus]|nr:AMP-binding protein [Streptomyces noursei]